MSIICYRAGQQHYSYTNVDGNIECVQKKEGNEIKWVNAKTWEPCSPQGKGQGIKYLIALLANSADDKLMIFFFFFFFFPENRI